MTKENDRKIMVGLGILLVAILAWVMAKAMKPDQLDTTHVAHEHAESSHVVAASTMWRMSAQSDLSTKYERRAYPGAPPVIPHPVEAGQENCLSCHKEGGYAETFQAFTPRTPHPELLACQQCHVEQNQQPLFAANNAPKLAPPKLGQAALPGSPPPIPHTTQLREDCERCHVGPAAPNQIRSSHPERVACQQCHVSQEAVPPFKVKR